MADALGQVGLILNRGKTDLLTTHNQHPADFVSPGGMVVVILERDCARTRLGCMTSTHTDGSHGPWSRTPFLYPRSSTQTNRVYVTKVCLFRCCSQTSIQNKISANQLDDLISFTESWWTWNVNIVCCACRLPVLACRPHSHHHSLWQERVHFTTILLLIFILWSLPASHSLPSFANDNMSSICYPNDFSRTQFLPLIVTKLKRTGCPTECPRKCRPMADWAPL